MGKSAVLKDLTGRPAGYMRPVRDGMLLRAPLEEPAQLGIVFADGSGMTYALERGHAEQHVSCKGKDAAGCYVFRKEELLLISDEAMRRAFEVQLCRQRKKEVQARGSEPIEQGERIEESKRPEENGRERQHAFAQRRWPPPPCWDTARYFDGDWQEE